MLFFLSVQYAKFPQRSDAILTKPKTSPLIEASGSSGIFYQDKCLPTYPNETLTDNFQTDWCSNVYPDGSDKKPWIIFSIPHKLMKLTGYSVRNGCCYYDCCCEIESGKIFDLGCCCRLYSFSLHGSNDNITWKEIHKIEQEKNLRWCNFRTYEFPITESFKFIKFQMDQPWPGCSFCLQINQFELYGETIQSFSYDLFENDENEESVSIIGKVKSN